MAIHRQSQRIAAPIIGLLGLAVWLSFALWLDQLGSAHEALTEPLQHPPKLDGSIDWMGLALTAIPLIAYFVFLLKLSDSQNRQSIAEQLRQAF